MCLDLKFVETQIFSRNSSTSTLTIWESKVQSHQVVQRPVLHQPNEEHWLPGLQNEQSRWLHSVGGAQRLGHGVGARQSVGWLGFRAGSIDRPGIWDEHSRSRILENIRLKSLNFKTSKENWQILGDKNAWWVDRRCSNGRMATV